MGGRGGKRQLGGGLWRGLQSARSWVSERETGYVKGRVEEGDWECRREDGVGEREIGRRGWYVGGRREEVVIERNVRRESVS